jgi:hypothetical protein
MVSDPNRADDPEYIVRLFCQVVAVSVETVRLTTEMAERVNFDDFKLSDVEGEVNPLKDYWKR